MLMASVPPAVAEDGQDTDEERGIVGNVIKSLLASMDSYQVPPKVACILNTEDKYMLLEPSPLWDTVRVTVPKCTVVLPPLLMAADV